MTSQASARLQIVLYFQRTKRVGNDRCGLGIVERCCRVGLYKPVLHHLPQLALTSGLREGELITLQWDDLDVEQKVLTVQEERAVKNGEPVVYGERTRVISLPYPTVVIDNPLP